MLRVENVADHEAASRQTVALVWSGLRGAPSPLLCVASGGNPTRAYQLLVERFRAEPDAAPNLRVLKLDEWLGLPEGSPGTCEEHLRRELVDPLGLAPRYTSFSSNPEDPVTECRRVAQWLQVEGPIDVCVLGLGVNGHLGFNEPGPSVNAHAHVAPLSDASKRHAMVSRMAATPSAGITLGMADLLGSRKIVVIATGEAKRGPVARLLREGITTEFPASFLHLHPDATLVTDCV